MAAPSHAVSPLTSEHAKRHRLLQQLHRRGQASRLRLARELRISNSRVCDLVDKMVDEGLLDEDADVGERRGRRGVRIRLNPRYGHFVGLDMEAKRLRLVLTDFTGQVVWETRRPRRSPALNSSSSSPSPTILSTRSQTRELLMRSSRASRSRLAWPRR